MKRKILIGAASFLGLVLMLNASPSVGRTMVAKNQNAKVKELASDSRDVIIIIIVTTGEQLPEPI